ncbi:MAG: site-specific integrase [Gammaproteobacteria bacterium]|jgi:site-specific recombinase XerD|nr:site-specific integrase [Gammaproteobacteria bacterium]MBT4194804.1 site-specific integrase [Gammaproteobacteria bacterium]MBT6550472.1 site-specific integrase [Gammaproteobacteria bacterium]
MVAQALTTLNQSLDIRIDIDWPVLLEQRQAVLLHTDVPAYLLLPEVHQLIDAARQDNLLLMMNTLWHTGARISECIALTPNHFKLDVQQPYVSIQTLKSRGRPKRGGQVKPRLVPISDASFVRQLERFIKTHQVKKHDRLFPITRSAANKRLDRLIEKMTVKPSINITPHTFRHSFAVNAIFHGTPLPVLQGWLGHVDIHSTLVYTQVLSLETYHLMQRIQF